MLGAIRSPFTANKGEGLNWIPFIVSFFYACISTASYFGPEYQQTRYFTTLSVFAWIYEVFFIFALLILIYTIKRLMRPGISSGIFKVVILRHYIYILIFFIGFATYEAEYILY
jgi:hypothetical protein